MLLGKLLHSPARSRRLSHRCLAPLSRCWASHFTPLLAPGNRLCCAGHTLSPRTLSLFSCEQPGCATTPPHRNKVFPTSNFVPLLAAGLSDGCCLAPLTRCWASNFTPPLLTAGNTHPCPVKANDSPRTLALFPCAQQGSVMAALLSQLAARRATSLPCSRRGTDSAALVTHSHCPCCVSVPL